MSRLVLLIDSLVRRGLSNPSLGGVGVTNGKGLHFCKPLIILVRPAGFEPTTAWFVVGP